MTDQFALYSSKFTYGNARNRRFIPIHKQLLHSNYSNYFSNKVLHSGKIIFSANHLNKKQDNCTIDVDNNDDDSDNNNSAIKLNPINKLERFGEQKITVVQTQSELGKVNNFHRIETFHSNEYETLQVFNLYC